MSNPDARTVIPGQMVTYHNEPTTPSRPVEIPTTMSADEFEVLIRAVEANARARQPISSLLILSVSCMSGRQIVALAGTLTALLDERCDQS